MSVNNVKEQIPTIDVALVTMEFIQDGKRREIGFDTANKVAVEIQSETTDAVKLIVKEKLRAQKKEATTVTGNKITLSDNVFMPEVVLLLQGGTIMYANKHEVTLGETLEAGRYYLDTTLGYVCLEVKEANTISSGSVISFDESTCELKVGEKVVDYDIVGSLDGETKLNAEITPTESIVGYQPPVVGSSDKGEIFKLNCYSAQYDEAGNIVKYEKITYPNCTGKPIALNSEDGAFRAPEYEIDSAPSRGEAPYKIVYVKNLPILE